MNMTAKTIAAAAVPFAALCVCGGVSAAEPFCPGGDSARSTVIWCDSFEPSEMLGSRIADNYYDFDDNAGDFAVTGNEHVHGSYAMRVRWQSGEVEAGSMMKTFGRNPIGSQTHKDKDFREIYWRIYVKLQDGFSGQPDKLTRATSFASPTWAQAMIAHLWAPHGVLEIDPASGIDANSRLATTKWNDFDHLRWLGSVAGGQKFEPGQWHCVETHVKFNTPGVANGIFEYWIDDKLQARRADLNWVGSWSDYGINAVLVSNYWGAGAPKTQERYLDAFVISTERVGCLGGVTPNAPANLTVR